MANLTLAIDDDLLREARVKAVQQGTSVNDICRQAIEHYVGRDAQGEHRAAMLRATFAHAHKRPRGAEPAWEGREAVYAGRVPPPRGRAT